MVSPLDNDQVWTMAAKTISAVRGNAFLLEVAVAADPNSPEQLRRTLGQANFEKAIRRPQGGALPRGN
jgi:hypothetical protein